MKFDFVKTETSKYQEVSEDSIEQAEKEMGFSFPKELVEFYREIGCGFIGGGYYNTNRVMGPISVCDFRLRQYDFEFYPDIEMYDDYEENKLIFFEQNLGSLFSIEITDSDEAKIYYYNDEIASSLKEFLEKMVENDRYFFEYFDKKTGKKIENSN